MNMLATPEQRCRLRRFGQRPTLSLRQDDASWAADKSDPCCAGLDRRAETVRADEV